MTEDLKTKVLDILERQCKTTEYRLVDIELTKSSSSLKLIVYIDKDQGVNIDDCVKFNNVINNIDGFDDLFESSYILEVSSPGTNRLLEEGESR
ncbi:MAG: hypothetical protein VX343_02220 [Thermodesulfobacteriota bacterium]|nr:hypothetical protein [Thermodesulfobacteriota bacterium]|tara:strand:+ start:11202 stop:11483 length:282 start_codon:yes stop_codon:yes gene_type:complete